jgi:hypothetical protein
MQRTLSFWLAAAAISLLAGPALVTPPAGIVNATLTARAAGFVVPLDVEQKVVPDHEPVLLAPDAQDTVTQNVAFPCRCPRCPLCRAVGDRSFEALTSESAVEGVDALPNDATHAGNCAF